MDDLMKEQKHIWDISNKCQQSALGGLCKLIQIQEHGKSFTRNSRRRCECSALWRWWNQKLEMEKPAQDWKPAPSDPKAHCLPQDPLA